MTWAWATASNKDRAEFVRGHAHMGKPRVCPTCGSVVRRYMRALATDDMCELFDLTHAELIAVLEGADYPARGDGE